MTEDFTPNVMHINLLPTEYVMKTRTWLLHV